MQNVRSNLNIIVSEILIGCVRHIALFKCYFLQYMLIDDNYMLFIWTALVQKRFNIHMSNGLPMAIDHLDQSSI